MKLWSHQSYRTLPVVPVLKSGLLLTVKKVTARATRIWVIKMISSYFMKSDMSALGYRKPWWQNFGDKKATTRPQDFGLKIWIYLICQWVLLHSGPYRYPQGSKYSLESMFCYFANAKFVLSKIALLQSSQNLAKCYSVSLGIQYKVAEIRFINTNIWQYDN